MKRILFNNFHGPTNEKLFSDSDIVIGDNLFLPFKILKETLAVENISCETITSLSVVDADIVIFIDLPKNNCRIYSEARKLNKPLFLLHFESHIIIQEIFQINLNERFDVIYSWFLPFGNELGEKFCPLHFSFDTNSIRFNNIYNSKIVNISSNKFSIHKDELYTMKRIWINNFNRYYPDRLDLYGYNWEILFLNQHNLISQFINRINNKFKLFKHKLKIYKGSINRKRDILSSYTFALVIENANFEFWITEKIWDSMINGVIPIYYGAANITSFIPENCFINLANFDCPKDLLNFIDKMTNEQIANYRYNIFTFLNSPKSNEFKINYFVESMHNTIKKYF